MKLNTLVKWIGGKGKLAPFILEKMPKRIEGTYFEPFVGGGGLFCALVSAGRIQGDVVLADNNRDLMSLYEQVRDDPKQLIDDLRAYEKRYYDGDVAARSSLYYEVRGEWNAGLRSPARFAFLKQTAFNGLWRVNKQGDLNAAWGKYERPKILDADGIRAWHKALYGATLCTGDAVEWDWTIGRLPTRGDVVYLDPPYAGTFGGYTREGFGLAQQTRLLDLARRFSEGGAFVGYSNSLAVEALLRLVWPCHVERLQTSYTVSRDATRRSGKEELFAWT